MTFYVISPCIPSSVCISFPPLPCPALPSGLHLVNLNGPAPWFRAIQVAGPLAAPSVLRYMATPSTRSEQVLCLGGGLGTRVSVLRYMATPSASNEQVLGIVRLMCVFGGAKARRGSSSPSQPHLPDDPPL